MTKEEKEYYNLYLSVSRSSRNKPFRLRKNFDGFEEKPEYLSIKKLCAFFHKFPNVKPKAYFEAPYVIYEDEEFFDLKFFTSQKAIKAYTLYQKLKREENPDTKDQLDFLKDSLRFIGMYCLKNNIPVEKYTTHKEGITYAWMKHYRQHNISIYSLMELPGLLKSLNDIAPDESDLFLDDVAETIFTYKTRYNNSKSAKYILKAGTNKIIEFVNKNLKKDSD